MFRPPASAALCRMPPPPSVAPLAATIATLAATLAPAGVRACCYLVLLASASLRPPRRCSARPGSAYSGWIRCASSAPTRGAARPPSPRLPGRFPPPLRVFGLLTTHPIYFRHRRRSAPPRPAWPTAWPANWTGCSLAAASSFYFWRGTPIVSTRRSGAGGACQPTSVFAPQPPPRAWPSSGGTRRR